MKIKNKFVIILGAGSSMEYGYPSGSKLQEIIIKRSRPIETPITTKEDIFIYSKTPDAASLGINSYSFSNEYYAELVSFFPKNLVEKFSRDLEIIDAPSIDAFISMPINKEYEGICKFTIVQTILSFEKKKLYDVKQGWYQKLHHMLFPVNSDTIDFSNLTFISFNYDRSFEHYFFEKIFSLCKRDIDIAYEQFKKIKIFHPYGMINDAVLPPKQFKSTWFRYGHLHEKVNDFRFQYNSEAELIHELSLNIDTIYESRKSKENEEIRKAIENAEAYIFLGFGYHELNLELLGIKSGHIYGTSYGLSKQQNLKIKQIYPNIQLQNCEVSEYMLQHVPFNDI